MQRRVDGRGAADAGVVGVRVDDGEWRKNAAYDHAGNAEDKINSKTTFDDLAPDSAAAREREATFWANRKRLDDAMTAKAWLARVAKATGPPTLATAGALAVMCAVGLPAKARRAIAALALALALARFLGVPFPSDVSDNPNLPVRGGPINAVRALTWSLHSFLAHSLRQAHFQTLLIVLPGALRAIAVMDERDRVHVLRTNWQNYTKNTPSGDHPVSFENIFHELLGGGIFARDGAEWLAHRKVASHMFSESGLRHKLQAVVAKHSKYLAEALRNKDGAVIDLQETCQSLTFDVICELVFGECPHALLETLEHGRKPAFLEAFDRAQCIAAQRGMQPEPVWHLARVLGVGSEAELAKCIKTIDAYIYDVIKRRRESGGGGNDLLSMYLDFAAKTGLTYIASDVYLRDTILNFMIAGRDTTSATICNWLRLMSTDDAVSRGVPEKLVREFEAHLPLPLSSDASLERVRECEFAQAVFNETLRLYPPVSADFRICLEDDTLPSGVHIRKGDVVNIANSAIGRDPALWCDADSFDPARWLVTRPNGDGVVPVRRPNEYTFPVFWGGSRLCLGHAFARIETILTASLVMRAVEFEVVSGQAKVGANAEQETFVNGPVAFVKGGVWARVKAKRA